MKRFYIFVIALVFALTLAACGGRQSDAPSDDAAETEPSAVETPDYRFYPSGEKADTPEPLPKDPPEPIETSSEAVRVQELLDSMSVEEKVGQLFFVQCPAADAAEKIAAYHLGGVLLFTRDYKDANENWLTKEQLVDKLQSYQESAQNDTGIPLFIGSDEEGGTVTRASRNPNLFPAKLPSPQELYQAGGLKGLLSETMQYNEQLLTLGINVNFAPVCDVSTDPNDFIYARSFGKNAAETMAYTAGMVEVMNRAGVGCVLKHFPGYGNNVDTHTGIAIDERPIETFRSSDFLPFQGGIKAGTPFVLVSHNIVKCMDADLPASLSPAVHEILRGELGFDGVVLTDDLTMEAVQSGAGSDDIATMALLAGNDMVVTADFETQIAQVLTAVERGILPMETVDAAVTRVLTAKIRLGLLGE